MALFAKLVDTSPTIKEFKKLQECLSSVADSFESLENVIPDSFSKNTKSAGTSIEHFSSSINELGNSFINISSYGERAVRVLNNISKADGDLSLSSALTSLSDGLRAIKDTSPVDDLAVSLKRLGDAMSSISKHGIDAANTMQLLAQGGSFSFAGDAPDLKVNRLSDTYKELVDSFDTSFKGVDLKESAITSVSNTMRVFKNALKLFDDDSMELAKKLADTDTLNQIKNGVVNFAEVFKEVRVLFYKTVMTDTESNDSTTIKTTTTEKNIDGILNTMKALKPAITSINDIISSESFNNLTTNATTIQKNFQAVGDIFASINTAFESKTTKIKSPETTVTADFEGIGNRLKAAIGLLNPLSDASDLQVGGKKTTTTNTTTTQVDLAIQGLLSLIKKVNQGVAEVNDIVKPDSPLHKFETEIGPKIKSQFNALGTSLQSIKAVFRESIEKTSDTTTSGSKQSNTKTTTISASIQNILDILKGIPAALKELRKVVDSDEFKNARNVMSSVKTLFKDIGDSLASVNATFTDKVIKTTTNESGIKTTTTEVTRSIDGITSLIGSIKKRFKKFASLKDDPALTNFGTVMTEVKEKLSSFVTSMNELSLEANFESTTKKGTFKTPVIDRVLSIISNLNSTIKKVANEAHPLKDKFLSVISKDVVEPIKEAVDILNGVDILLMEDSGGSGKKIAVIDKVVAYIRAITGVMNNVNKVPDNVANRLTILASAISMSMSTLSNAATGPVFERFERLTNVLLNFSIATKSIVTNVDKAERSMAKLSKTTDTATKSTNWFAGGWRSVVSAFSGGTVIYTIVRAIRDAVKEFVELDKKLRQINTLVGMSERSLSNLGSTIVSTAGKFGLNLDQAADSMFAIHSATLRGADAVRVFNASAMLSVAGNADLKNSTELITRSIMAYGKHSTEAQHIADVLFKTQDRGIVVVEELAHNLTKVVPSAVAARVSFEEINAAMATLTTKGLQATVASTALNSMLLKLTSGSERLDSVFQKLGYDSSATALKQRGLEYVMRQISAATGGAAYELQKLGFNYRDIKAAAILANDTNGFFAETLRYINDEAEEGGKALQAYKEVCKSISQQVSQLIATLKGAVVGISEFVAKWSGLKVILGLLNSFIQVKSDFNTLAGAIKMVAGPIFQVITGATLLASSLTLLVGMFIKLKGAITALSLAKLSASLKEVNKDSGVFAQGAKHLFDLFSTGSGSILGAIKTQIELIRATKASTEASDNFARAKRNLNHFSIKYQEAMKNSADATLRLKNAQNQATQASVAFKNSLKGFGKAVAWMAAITLALTALSWAWNKLSAAMDDKKAAKIRAEFSDMASEIDKLKTVTQVETRIEALSAQLEKLSSMSPTANVKALMKEYQAAIEKLNQKKMDMTSIQNAGESFEKLEEARKKLLMLDVNKMQQVNILKAENYELSKQLAMLPKASSAWAKMATKITNNTIKIKQLTNELRGMYDFIPQSLYDDVDNLYGDSLKGTSEKLKLKEDEIKTLLQKQGWDPAAITQVLADSAFTSADFQKMQRSMQDAYAVRNSLVDRTRLAMGQGVTKTMATRFQGGVNTDLQSLGIKGVDQSVLTKHLPEVMNIIANLNNDIMTATSANLKGEDRINEAILLRKKELQAIVDIQSKFVDGNANATKEQKDALAAAKEQLKAYNDRVNSALKLKEAGKSLSNFGLTKWSESSQARLSVKSLFNTDGQFREILTKYLDGDKKSEFDSRLRDESGNISYSKGLATAVNKALKEYVNVTVGAIRSPLQTTSAQAKAVGSLNADKTANEAVLKLFKDWHELQLKSNKQYAEAYRKLYASSYDVYNSLRNASFGNLAGKIGSVNRDPMDLLREKILSPTGASSDAVAAAGKTLKQFGVFDGKNLDVSNANFRDAVTQAMISASSVGGEKGMQAFQQWLTAMQTLQGKLQELKDPYSKNRRKYIDAMGTPSEKLSLLKSDASKLNKLYTTELSKKMPDASLLENLQNAIWDNAVQQKQILASIPAGKPVPVSEQVSLASKEAYHLLQAQTTSNEGQKRMYTHVGDINANFKHFIKKFDRDSRAVYTAQKQEAVNMVVAVTP